MKILIAEAVHPILREELSGAGFSCFDKSGISYQELSEIIPDFDGLIIRSKFKISADFIDQAKNLQFIARAGAGMENIDVAYAKSKGIVCINTPEGNRESVGEHALSLILSLLRKTHPANISVKSGIWDRKKYIGETLSDKTVGILGYGNMGSALAESLRGFKCNVIAYDKYKKNYGNQWVKEVSLEQFFRETEVLSLHIPLTPANRFFVDADFLQKFRNNLYVLNTARGKILKTEDLVTLLKTGKIKAAGLDVLEYEEDSFDHLLTDSNIPALSYLLNADNVILTPHVAGSSDTSFQKIAEVLAEKIKNKFSTFSS